MALLGHDGVAVHDDHVRALQDHPPFLCNSEVEMSRSIFICDTMEFLKLSICTVHTHRQIYRQTDILPQNLDIVPINLSQSKHTKCSYVNNEVMYRVTLVIALHGLVDFNFDVPSSCPPAQPFLPNSHMPKQNPADSGASKSKSTKPWWAPTSHPVLTNITLVQQYADQFKIQGCWNLELKA